MTTTLHQGSAPSAAPGIADGHPGPLGSWVEPHSEPCRGGRSYRLLVNHRTHQALDLTDGEAGVCDQLTAGRALSADPATTAFVADLREQGFLAAEPPSPARRRALQASAARLDLRWTGAGWLVRAAHDHGGRYLFRPAAVAAQAVVALAGLAAVIGVVISGPRFQLRVHPAQIPVIIGLSLAAVAVHELAHALVVVHHGRTVDAAGVRIHLGTPAFYVESADALLLTRRVRIIQAAVGVWAEWQFTSLVAIWLWCSPVPFAAPMLYRFVILNAVTIVSNLIPFTGLDGSWLLADLTGAPDLPRRARGSVTRLLTALASRQPNASGAWLLAGYSAANGLVATGLLATAVFFWYQLFGDLAATLLHAGPAGWLALAVGAVMLGRPAVTSAAARLPAALLAARELRDTIRFRLQWRWRIAAARQLAATPLFAQLTGAQLGVLAGHLRRTRHRGPIPATLAASCGVVAAGAVSCASASGEAGILTAGGTWNPRQRLSSAASRTVLVYLPAPARPQIPAACPLA
jgi:putative peptide zinc metalloprotease protein